MLFLYGKIAACRIDRGVQKSGLFERHLSHVYSQGNNAMFDSMLSLSLLVMFNCAISPASEIARFYNIYSRMGLSLYRRN